MSQASSFLVSDNGIFDLAGESDYSDYTSNWPRSHPLLKNRPLAKGTKV